MVVSLLTLGKTPVTLQDVQDLVVAVLLVLTVLDHGLQQAAIKQDKTDQGRSLDAPLTKHLTKTLMDYSPNNNKLTKHPLLPQKLLEH